jgi:ABC-2 type transport system permease protein
MRSARTIFVKQAKDMFKNPMVLVMFIVFPAVAFIMTNLIDLEDMPPNMFVTMMGAIFAGMGLITSMAAVIAEDIERKSLRFLVMAGVKPHQYLLGTGGFVLLMGAVTSLIFALIGTFTAAEFVKFLAVMVSASAASVLLGATFGLLAGNQQAASGLVMPVALILGFTPMIANFNETVEKFAGVLYTQQMNVIVNDFSANFGKAMIVIGVNIAVLLILFVLAYRSKGLKG